MIDDALDVLLSEGPDPVAAGVHLQQLAACDPKQSLELFVELARDPGRMFRADPAVVGGLVRVLHTLALRHERDAVLLRVEPSVVVQINEGLPKQVSNRYLLLHLLAVAMTPESLGTLVELLKFHAPDNWMHAAQVISPLMQTNQWPLEVVFPELLSCLSERSLAAPILDLANHMVRSRRVHTHPATDQVQALNHLLGEVSNRLGKFEENPREFGSDVQEVQERLGQAVALAVSLCDAVALVGDESSIGKLNRAVELRHRRVQCEAAGALASFDIEEGRERLIELAKDPAARLRAIHYADELGMGDDIDEQFRTPESTAESELSIWLAQPQQMGVPPTKVEVIDSKRMLWPSFNDPVDVYLVRFEYNFGDRQYSNVGITGPTVHTLSADVADMPLDDIYAIYAGWHAEHNDIFSVRSSDFNQAQSRIMTDFHEHLDRLGYEEIGSELLGFLLDEQAGVCRARRDGTQCLVVTDGLETIDYPVEGRPRPLGPDDIFNLYKGRKMLRIFNPS